MPRNAVGMSSGYDHRESQVSFRQIQVFRRHDNGIAELSVLGESIYMRPWCFQWTWRKTSQSDFKMSQPLRANIQRGNPEKVFDLIEKVGGGTYGDVFKVCLYISLFPVERLLCLIFNIPGLLYLILKCY